MKNHELLRQGWKADTTFITNLDVSVFWPYFTTLPKIYMENYQILSINSTIYTLTIPEVEPQIPWGVKKWFKGERIFYLLNDDIFFN